MLPIGVCYKLLASQVLHRGPKELEDSGHEIGTVVHNFIALVQLPFTSPVSSLGPGFTVQNDGGWLQQPRPLMTHGLP